MLYEESDLKFGLWEAGSSIIMHLLTQHCQLDNSWEGIQFLFFHFPPIHLTSPLMTFFFLFPKLRLTLKGRRFQTVEDIITNATKELKAIPQTPFKQCFQKWKKQWKRCIAVQGDCFEGDNIQ
jgi:hypothetical protein